MPLQTPDAPGVGRTAPVGPRPAPTADSPRGAGASETPTDRRTSGGRRGCLLARLVGAVAAGLLLLVAFPPSDLWWCAPVGVAALHLAVAGAGLRVAAGLGLLGGVVLFVPLLSWSGVEVGAVPWLLLALSQAAWFAPLGVGLALVAPLRLAPLAVAALWVAQEAARGRVPFGGFPWGRLAFSAADSPALGLAALGGAPLVSAGVALVGGLLAAVVLALSRTRRRAGSPRPSRLPTALGPVAALAAGLVAVPVLAALGTGPAAPEPVGSTVAAVVQGNVPRLGLDFAAQRRAVLDNHVAATEQLAADVAAGRVPAPRLVVWPENSSDIDPLRDDAAAAALDRASRAVGQPLLVGAVLDAGPDAVENAGLVWDPDAGLPGEDRTYVKRHPVPFGEYIPLRPLARAISEQVDRVPRDFRAGDRPGVLQLAGVPVGDVICFEVAYDGLVHDVATAGTQVLVVQTNNATFGYSAETHQQLAMGRLRAVEHGRAVLVAATSGVSAVLAPDGEVVSRAGIFERAVLVEEVPLVDGLTPAGHVGAVPEAVMVVAALLAVGAGARRHRARREGDTGSTVTGSA